MKIEEKNYQKWVLFFLEEYLNIIQESDLKETSRNIKVLENFIYKVKNLDMVFLIVGTMSSGKSTFLNSVIGENIAPNRETPMTLVPCSYKSSTKTKLWLSTEFIDDIIYVVSFIKNKNITNLPSDLEYLNNLYEISMLMIKVEKEELSFEEINLALKILNDVYRVALDHDIVLKVDINNLKYSNIPQIQIPFKFLEESQFDNLEFVPNLVFIGTFIQ
jgi:ABC-type phosphate/phosphonate transport system ATPase subunit